METFFSRNWSVNDFIKFVLPSVLSVITISLYMVVDTLFISRFVGPLALAAVNITMPLFNFCFAIGIMMAAGSSALVGIELGENKLPQGRNHFSLTFCFLLLMTSVFFVSLHGLDYNELPLFSAHLKRCCPIVRLISQFSASVFAQLCPKFFLNTLFD